MDEYVPTEASEIYRLGVGRMILEIAKRNGALKTSSYQRHGKSEEAEFVLLDKRYDWEGIIGTRYVNFLPLVNAISRAGNTGLFTDRGIFIISENTPHPFRPKVVAHEAVESESVDVALSVEHDMAIEMNEEMTPERIADCRRYAHKTGCLVELANVFNDGETFSNEYSAWILKSNGSLEDRTSWFNQAYPRFLGPRNRLNRPSLETVAEFYLSLCRFGSRDITDDLKHKVVKRWNWLESYLPKDNFSE